MGWATDKACGPNGTTGGGSGEPTVIVTNDSEFKSAMASRGPKVIGVKGKLGGQMAITASDKTVIGIGTDAQIDGGFRMSGSNNIIFRNMTFSGGKKGQSIDDAFELSGSTCFWFDHNTFRDGGDGNHDLVRGSDYITNSWNKYYYTKKHGHMLSNLIGNKNNNAGQDGGKLKITFYGNYFGAGIQSRSPRVRYGKVHLFNNYWHYESVEGSKGNYSIGGGLESNILVENNHFDGIVRTSTWMSDSGTAIMEFRNNKFTDAGSKVERGTAFKPPYKYDMFFADEVKALVTANAGPK